MRGLILSSPAVAAALTHYIVTWWEGPDDEVPRTIHQIEAGARFQRRGNVSAFVLDSGFRTVAGFVPYPGERPFDRQQGDPATYFAEEVRRASLRMGLPPAPPPRAVSLPTLPVSGAHPAGVRAIIKITGDLNVHVPLVETAAVPRSAWEALRYPSASPREVPAHAVAALLASLYPPAMMDQENRVKDVRGILTLSPDLGSPGRNALLSGDVEVVLAAATRFTGRRADPWRQFVDLPIAGRLDLAVTYPAQGELPSAVDGLFHATYSKPGHMGRRGPEAQLQAILESVP